MHVVTRTHLLMSQYLSVFFSSIFVITIIYVSFQWEAANMVACIPFVLTSLARLLELCSIFYLFVFICKRI